MMFLKKPTGNKPVAPIFSMKEINEFEHNKDLENNNEKMNKFLTQSRFLFDEQNNVITPGLQLAFSSIDQSSIITDKNIQELRITSPSVKYTIKNNKVVVTETSLKKQNKKKQMVLSYPQRIERAKKMQEKREAKRQKQLRKMERQEKKFQKMMEKLKKEQQKKQKEKKKKKKSSKSSDKSSKSGSSSSSSVSSSESDDKNSKQKSSSEKDEEESSEISSSESSEEDTEDTNLSALNHSLFPQNNNNSIQDSQQKIISDNPFQNTPHQEIVAKYMFEAPKQLQTLDPKSKGFLPILNKSLKLKQMNQNQFNNLEKQSQLAEITNDISQNLIEIQRAQNQSIQLNINNSSFNTLAPDYDRMNQNKVVFINTFQNLDQSIQKNKQINVESKLMNDFKNLNIELDDKILNKKGDFQKNNAQIKSLFSDFATPLNDQNLQTGSQFNENVFQKSLDFTNQSKSSIQHNLKGSIHFKNELQNFRLSQEIPVFLKNQKFDQKNFFKKQFDNTQKEYGFLLQTPQSSLNKNQQRKKLNISIDFGSQDKSYLLPNINNSSKFQKNDHQWKVWPNNSPQSNLQQFVEIKPSQKIILENINTKKISTDLNLNYLKSPRLKQEIVKCAQKFYSNLENIQNIQNNESIKKQIGKSTYQTNFQANSKIAFQNMYKSENKKQSDASQQISKQIQEESTKNIQTQSSEIDSLQIQKNDKPKDESRDYNEINKYVKSNTRYQSIKNFEEFTQKQAASIKKHEIEAQNDQQKYQDFLQQYLQPRVPINDPISSTQNYFLGQVQDTIDLTDNLIRYKESIMIKSDHESFKRKKSQKLLQIAKIKIDNQNKRNVFMDDDIQNLKNDARVFSSDNSQSLSSKESKQTKKRVFINNKQQSQSVTSSVSASNEKMQDEKNKKKILIQPLKNQNLCIVEKIALNFLYEIYQKDDRYLIDDNEQNRVQFINVNEQNLYMEDSNYYEDIISKQMQILCNRHGDTQFDDKQQKKDIIQKFDQFYQSLLNDNQSKISKEQICKIFLDYIMDKRNYEFKELRLKILNKNGYDQDNCFQILRDLNPEIFIKFKSQEEQNKNIVQSSNRQKIELKSHQKNNLYSYNSNKQIFVNKQIFDNLVRGMIESEIQEKTNNIKQKLLRKYSKNEIIDFNINARKLEQKQKQLVSKLTKKNLVEGLNLSQKDLRVAQQIQKMKEALKDSLKQRMMNYANFQKSAKNDILKQLSSQDIGNFLKDDPFENINNKNAIQLLQTNLNKTQSPLDIQKNDQQFLLDMVNKMNNSASLESLNRDEKKSETALEVFTKDYETLKFYAIQKQYNDQPSSDPNSHIDYYLKLKQKCCLQIPYFVKINQKTLNIQSRFLNTETIYALTDFILAQSKLLQQKKNLQKSGIDIFENEALKDLWDLQSGQIYIKNLIIDDCNMKDEDFAIFLGAVSIQNKLQSLTYINNEFGQKSILALSEIIQQKEIKDTQNLDLQIQIQTQNSKSKKDKNQFKHLSLCNLKTDQSTIQQLLEYIDQENQDNPLLSIKLSELDINNPNSVYYLCNQFYVNKKLQKFNISGSKINTRNLHVLTECLAKESEIYESSRRQEDVIRLQYLNLSYISILEGSDSTKYSDKIVFNLSEFLKNAYVLVHLDISGMNLRDKIMPILKSIKQNKQQTLVSIHMNDNLFTLQQKDDILFLMGIDTQKYHYIHDNINVQEQDPMEIALLQQLFLKEDKIKKVSNHFFKKQRPNFLNQEQREKAFEADIMNQQISQKVNEQKIKIRQDQFNGSSRRDKKVQDPMILTRKLGLPELIFNENLYCRQELSDINSTEKWSFFNSKTGDDCYVCQKYNYVQVFYNRKKINDEFQKISNSDYIQMLVDTYEINQLETLKSGSPLLISSLNNWVLTRLVNVKIYSQILKGDDDEFAKKLIRKQQMKQKKILEIEEKQLSEKFKIQKKDTHLNQQQKQQALKEQEMLKNLEDKLNFIKDDKKYIRQELNIVKRKAKLLQRSVSGMNQNLIVGLNVQKNNQKSIESQIIDEHDQNDLNEILEDNEWFDIIQNCPKYKEKQININFPQDDSVNGDDLFVFSGFVKPGFHVIIVFDPVKEEFFKRDILIEVRKDEILIQNAKKQKDDDQNENINTVTSDVEDEFRQSIFEKWKVDDEQRIQNIYLSDFQKKEFSKEVLEINKQQFFEIQNYLPQIYKCLIQAHTVYLSNDKIYPQSSIQKLYNFLIEIGIVAQNNQHMKQYVKLNALIEILSEFFNFEMNNNENFQQFTQRFLQDKNIVVSRFQFIFVILIVSIQNYKISKIKTKDQEFTKYFEQHPLQKINQYITKYQYHTQNFRNNILWKEPVPQFLFQNKQLLDKIFFHYQINYKFTMKSALNMLNDANINFKIDFSNLSHIEHVNRLFSFSKQTVQIDNELYMYQFLEQIEFYEFIGRVAFQYYNQWFYKLIDLPSLKEQAEILYKNLKKSGHDLSKLTDDQRLLYDRIHQRSMALESLQFKIYHLFNLKFARQIKGTSLNTELLASEIKEFQARRQAIQIFDIDKFLNLENEFLIQNEINQDTVNNDPKSETEDIFNNIVHEDSDELNGEYNNINIYSNVLSSMKYGDGSVRSVSNSSQDKSKSKISRINHANQQIQQERIQNSRNQNMRINEQSTQN